KTPEIDIFIHFWLIFFVFALFCYLQIHHLSVIPGPGMDGAGSHQHITRPCAQRFGNLKERLIERF
ncbi:hypothetical protein KJW28_25430, partial [Pseudomonas syringae pv. aptata]|uniref:hypothetical protein n=1 Tax=Pseudomonas syringae TaxID=317 RepID=UPI001BDCA305